MSSETASKVGLHSFLAKVSSSNPEVGKISVDSQCLIISIDYSSQSHEHGFRTTRIELFSEVSLRTGEQTLSFCSPIENWKQSIPNRIFSIEGEKVSSVVLKENSFQINLENACLSAPLNDLRFPESVHIFTDDKADAFII